ITERCNLRCRYCMPAEGIALKRCDEMLSYEQLLKIADAASLLGIRKVRVTGGEPLVRKGVTGFLRQLCAIPGLDEVTLTSNGLLLAENAYALHEAGIRRINLSLDSLEPQTFAAVTRGGELQKVMAGIEAAEKVGLRLKLNMVVMRGVNDHELENFAALSLDKPWSVRFIEYMPTDHDPSWRQRSVSGAEIVTRLANRFELEELARDNLCGPARPYRIHCAQGTLGIITPMSEHFCSSCNRVRVTADGHARSCLLADHALDLRPALADDDPFALRKILQRVILAKSAHHQLGDARHQPQPFAMNSIGG
ncbi:MAG: GTP 3',8-cyclase MoaA, partial [Desulfuromonas sp.]